MISIIICSRTSAINPALKKNISETIGCAFEMVLIDNSKNQYSIFEAYNLGISQSKFDILCFMHDDILLHTTNWGKIVSNLFSENENVGLVGIAGAKTKTKMASAWWDCTKEEKAVSIIQHFKDGKIETLHFGFTKESEEVVAIDGVFMVWKKNNQFQFDTSLKGFHNYDLNLSLATVASKQHILVTNQLLVEHFSLGDVNKSWVVSTYQIHKKYNKVLNTISTKKSSSEVRNAKQYLNLCLKYNCYSILLRVWFQLVLIQPLDTFHWAFLKKIIKKQFR